MTHGVSIDVVINGAYKDHFHGAEKHDERKYA